MSDTARLRPLDWPRMPVDVHATPEQLAAMIARVESMFSHLGESDPVARGEHDSYLAARVVERPPEFFERGQTPVLQFLATLGRCGIAMDGLHTCYELGCGIGRSTIWLSEWFETVIATDVSAPAIEQTRRNLERFARRNVQLVHTNQIATLEERLTLDAFFSIVVLQHNPPPVQGHILRVMLANLRSGGVAYFQLPTYRRGYSFNAADYLASPLKKAAPEMHVFPQPELHRLFDAAGCDLIEFREDPIPGEFVSNRILVQKR